MHSSSLYWHRRAGTVRAKDENCTVVLIGVLELEGGGKDETTTG